MSDEVKSVSFDNFKHTISTFFSLYITRYSTMSCEPKPSASSYPQLTVSPTTQRKLSNQPYKPNKNNKEPITITKNNPVFIF